MCAKGHAAQRPLSRTRDAVARMTKAKGAWSWLATGTGAAAVERARRDDVTRD